MNVSQDTIVAIATPPGCGGVGIVRLSGPLAYLIARQITKQINLKPRHAMYTAFFDKQDKLIDNGLMIYFRAPYSFTGEDVIELHAHGAPVVLDYLVQECISYGARLAKPGEFSERAFLNDKIDLTQAEAIADLIHANSLTAARMAVRSLQGDFSQKIKDLNEQIIHLRLYVEAAIDFPEEEIDFLSEGNILRSLNEIITHLDLLCQNASQGVMLREGLSIVIAGKPNAGKSTLINRLAGREVAIVTEVAGTTRDVMRETVLLDELPVLLIDTAGLRESNDLVEQEGIKRAWEEVSQADCVVLLTDVKQENQMDELHESILARLPTRVPLIKVFNKIDTLNQNARQEDTAIYLSAKSGDGIDIFINTIKSAVGFQPAEGQFLARRRHLDALDRAKEFLLAGQNQLIQSKAAELLAEELRLAHQCLCEITGEFTSDDLLGKLFSSFCIGK